MKMSEFTDWLDEKLKEKEWLPATLADKAGISRSGLSNLYTGKRKPGSAMCKRIAKALGVDENTVFIKAGIMKERKDEEVSEYDRQIISLTKQLASKTEKDGFYGIAKAYIEATKSNRRGSTGNAGQGVEKP